MPAERQVHPGSTPSSSTRAPDALLRRRARTFVMSAGSRLRLAAARVGGDSGLALACAAIDMIGSEVDPVCWPVSALLALLDGDAVNCDRQVERLVAELRRIEAEIETLSAEWTDEEATRRPTA